MAAFRIQAQEAWERLYRRKPPWRPAHLSALDEAERVCGTIEAAMQSWETYLAIRDNKYFHGHSPILFAKHIEEFCVIPQPSSGIGPKAPPCALCDGNGWRYVENITTPRGAKASSGAEPCVCVTGRRIASKIREESSGRSVRKAS